MCIFQNKYYLYHYLIYFTVYHCFVYHQRFIKGSFEKNLSQTPFLITVWPCSFFFSFFHSLWDLKFTGDQITKKEWWALYDKWKFWIDTSWLVLYNALRFEKMQKRFVGEHRFYMNSFTLLISNDPFLLRLEIFSKFS